MTGIIMFLLFLLNIVTIFAVVVLFLRQNRFIQVEKEQKAMIAEMEELLSGYMLEMKEENEALLEKITTTRQPTVKENGSLISKETTVHDGFHMDGQNPPQLSNTIKKEAVKAYKNQPMPKEKTNVEGMPEDEILVELSVQSKDQHSENASFKDTLQASLNGQVAQEPSLHEQVASLAKQGLSAEEIAQKLKCGKTEVELLLKFQTSQ